MVMMVVVHGAWTAGMVVVVVVVVVVQVPLREDLTGRPRSDWASARQQFGAIPHRVESSRRAPATAPATCFLLARR